MIRICGSGDCIIHSNNSGCSVTGCSERPLVVTISAAINWIGGMINFRGGMWSSYSSTSPCKASLIHFLVGISYGINSVGIKLHYPPREFNIARTHCVDLKRNTTRLHCDGRSSSRNSSYCKLWSITTIWCNP